MINVERAAATLQKRFPGLERVSDSVLRGVDTYAGQPYAIRYFDLSDDLAAAVGHLREYQDKLLGVSYFNAESRSDLRWNHYLYFVTSTPTRDAAYLNAKALVEADREYARKLVVTEDELPVLFADLPFDVESARGLPPDALSIWTGILDQHQLGFVVDERLQVPAIVRHIADGDPQPVLRRPAVPELDAAEQSVPTDFLERLTIQEFRHYPLRKVFDFGIVNLIIGVNGVGKTSLLEAIEYLYCGKTRRATAVPQRTLVSGVLAQSKLTLQTKPSTPHAKLRSRHLVWYGKAELRTLTLHDSFSKFNFLDTDAAVRLTVEKSSERIIDDLAQLLLGAEAAKTLDKFERVAGQLQDSERELESAAAMRDFRRDEASARLQQLRQAPRESDQLFKELLLSLAGAGWTLPPTEKAQTDQLSESLQAALIGLGVLRSTAPDLPLDVGTLDTALAALAQSKGALAAITKESVQRERERARITQHLREAERRLEALDGLAPIVGSGVGEMQRRYDLLERQLAERSAAFASAETASLTLNQDRGLGRLMLSSAIGEWAARARTAGESADKATATLTAFERNQTLAISLQQRLRSVAIELIQHTHDTGHCPLCSAEYAEGALLKRIEEAAQGLLGGESDKLRSEVLNAQAVHERCVSELRALQALERYSKGDPAKTSVTSAIRAVAVDRQAIALLQSERDSARLALEAHQQKGWTFARLRELASTAGIDGSEASVESVDELRERVRHEQGPLREALGKLEADGKNSESQVAQIGAQQGLGALGLSDLAGTLSERTRAIEAKRKAIVQLQSRLGLTASTSETELEARLRESQSISVRLRTSLARELQDSEAISRELKLIEDASAEASAFRVKLRRVQAAVAVIQSLLSQQSERLLAQQVLRENAAKIASTFAKIHAPNEFDLVVEDELKIMRRGGGTVDLDQMSSGQRAAYALSLFLAMNERLRTGPRVLMFDDPVAHVDDINTLSLLDYLRDIALSEQRQIFFATADSKLANLFGRKFRFLGDRYKEIELARR